MQLFTEEEKTQPIPYETLKEAARKWREELAREKIPANNAENPQEIPKAR